MDGGEEQRSLDALTVEGVRLAVDELTGPVRPGRPTGLRAPNRLGVHYSDRCLPVASLGLCSGYRHGAADQAWCGLAGGADRRELAIRCSIRRSGRAPAGADSGSSRSLCDAA